MKDNTEENREFLENLDKVLKGREDEITGQMDDDTRSVLDFARKIASLRETPSGEFAENLKAQLIHQLAEQRKKDSINNISFLFWEIPRKTMWQGTIAALILVIITAIILVITLVLNKGN